MAVLADSLKKLIFGRAFKAENGRVTIMRNFSVSFFECSALAMTVQELFNAVGKERSMDIWINVGEQAVTEGVRSFGVKSPKGHASLFRTNLGFMDFFGWGKFDIKKVEWDIKNFNIIFEVTNSAILEYGADMYGSKSAAYLFIMGVYAGFMKAFTGKRMIPKILVPYSKNNPALVFEVK